MVERYRRRKPPKSLLGNHQKCWLWGRHVVLETLRAARWPILELRLSDRVDPQDVALAENYASTHHVVLSIESAERLTQLSHTREHQGFLAKMAPFPYVDPDEVLNQFTDKPLFGILDGLQDPHNFGAVVRSAHVLGVHALFVAAQGQVEVTTQVARSSAGAVNHLPIAQAEDLVGLAERLRHAGSRLIGTSQRATKPIFDCQLTTASTIVIGNEGTGIRPELLAVCDELVTIPQFGALESLNAAVSAGVLFYEAQRQRLQTTRSSSRR